MFKSIIHEKNHNNKFRFFMTAFTFKIKSMLNNFFYKIALSYIHNSK